MYKRFDVTEEKEELIEEYLTKQHVIDDATRFYHEQFTLDEDYDEDYEIKSYEQAIRFWEGNGYEIQEEKQDDYICPVCKSKNIECYGSEIDGTLLSYRYSCNNCNSTFDGNYELEFTGYDNIVDNRESNQSDEKLRQHDQQS